MSTTEIKELLIGCHIHRYDSWSGTSDDFIIAHVDDSKEFVKISNGNSTQTIYVNRVILPLLKENGQHSYTSRLEGCTFTLTTKIWRDKP